MLMSNNGTQIPISLKIHSLIIFRGFSTLRIKCVEIPEFLHVLGDAYCKIWKERPAARIQNYQYQPLNIYSSPTWVKTALLVVPTFLFRIFLSFIDSDRGKERRHAAKGRCDPGGCDKDSALMVCANPNLPGDL